ncbi:class I SAM-dependent methyltransferase [Oscillospiraceae bacterium MB08-C2-2]|nr:class I SAM-dependent methyltransferase [Oscillospiraceae bacterium MB08-C2-2]
MSYSVFARHYDTLTDNVDYAARAKYFDSLIHRYNLGEGRLLLDLACGTGSLTLALADLGYECIGVDGSQEMLSMAYTKTGILEKPPLFLCQDMEELDLYGTVDVAVCALDSLNHITAEADLREVFHRVGLFTNPGGLFLFDVNTFYKHQNILGDSVFVLEKPSVYCVWQNAFSSQDGVVEVTLDFFEKLESGRYNRSRECFCERAYPISVWEKLLEQAGFELLAIFHEDSFEPPQESSERLVFAARKKEQERN